MNRLKIFTIVAEVTIVATLAVSSYVIAFAGQVNTNWLIATPLLTVLALESLRLPIAFNFVKSRLIGRMMSAALVLGLSVVTGEAALIAFENLIFQRTRPVAEAELNLKKAEDNQASLKGVIEERNQERDKARVDVESARALRAAVDEPIVQSLAPAPLPEPPQLKPPLLSAPLPITVVHRDKKGHQWTVVTNKAAIDDAIKKNQDIQLEADHRNAESQHTTVEGNAEAQRKWAEENRAKQDEHDAELKTADAAIAAAQAKLDAVAPDPDTKTAKETVLEAQRQVDDARSLNPMFRVAAAWQQIPVAKLDSQQFEQVKHWAVIALAGATALVTALAAVIADLPTRDPNGRPSKLNRMIRAWVARRRRAVYRDVPGPETIKEVEVFRDVPGPARIKEVEVIKEVPVPVPGPERIKEVPGPVEYRPAPGPIEYRDVPGPERIVEKVVVKWVPYDVATGMRIKADGTLGEVANLRSVQ